MLYFAAVSWEESRERLRPSQDDAWTGLLGVGDPLLSSLPEDSLGLLEMIGDFAEMDDTAVGRFIRWTTDAIEGRNVAGLSDPLKANLYGVDMKDLERNAGLLGMTGEEVLAALPSLRGTQRPEIEARDIPETPEARTP